MAENRLFNIHALFAEIDVQRRGFLTIESLEAWANTYGMKRLNWYRIAKLLNNGVDGERPTQQI